MVQRWRLIEFPEEVGEDEQPFSTYYISKDDIIIAQLLNRDIEEACRMVKRLNDSESGRTENLEDLLP